MTAIHSALYSPARIDLPISTNPQLPEQMQTFESRIMKLLEELQSGSDLRASKNHEIEQVLEKLLEKTDQRGEQFQQMKEIIKELSPQRVSLEQGIDHPTPLTQMEKTKLLLLVIVPPLLIALGRDFAAYVDLNPYTLPGEAFWKFDAVDATAVAMQLLQLCWHGRSGTLGLRRLSESASMQFPWIVATAFFHMVAKEMLSNAKVWW